MRRVWLMVKAPEIADDGASKLAGRLSVLLAAVLWSTNGFFGDAPIFKEYWDDDIRGIMLAFWRAVFASLALVPMVRRISWSPWLIPSSLIFVVMNVTFLNAMAYGGPTTAIWLQNTAPGWVFVIGVFLFRERAVPRDWLLLLFCVLGVGFILYFGLQETKSAKGVIWGVFGGLTYAAVVISLRQLRGHDAIWLIALNLLVTAVALSPFVVLHSVEHGDWPHDWQWLYLAAFGILQMGIPYVLFARGLRQIAGHEASGITLLEPILVPVWVFLAWHNSPLYEAPRWWTFVGGGLILIGLIVRYFGITRRAVKSG